MVVLDLGSSRLARLEDEELLVSVDVLFLLLVVDLEEVNEIGDALILERGPDADCLLFMIQIIQVLLNRLYPISLFLSFDIILVLLGLLHPEQSLTLVVLLAGLGVTRRAGVWPVVDLLNLG